MVNTLPAFANFAPDARPSDMGGGYPTSGGRGQAPIDPEPFGPPPVQPQAQPIQQGPNGERIQALLTPEELSWLQHRQNQPQTQPQPNGQTQQGQFQPQMQNPLQPTQQPVQGRFADVPSHLLDENNIPQQLSDEEYLALIRAARTTGEAQQRAVEALTQRDQIQQQVRAAPSAAEQMAALQNQEAGVGRNRLAQLQSAVAQIRNGADPEQVLGQYFMFESQLHGSRLQQLVALDQAYQQRYNEALASVYAPDYANFVASQLQLPPQAAQDIYQLAGGNADRFEEVGQYVSRFYQQQQQTNQRIDQTQRELAARVIGQANGQPPMQAGMGGGQPQYRIGPGSKMDDWVAMYNDTRSMPWSRGQ